MYRKDRVGEGILVHVPGGLDEDGALPEAVRAGDPCRACGADCHALFWLQFLHRGVCGGGGCSSSSSSSSALLFQLHLVLPRQFEVGAYPALEEADKWLLVIAGVVGCHLFLTFFPI